MTELTSQINSVRVATFRAPLPVPVVFGNWVMRHREFAVCGVVADDGTVGVSFCYTRDGPIAGLVERLIAPHYVGADPGSPEILLDQAAWSNNAVLASGVGHRALSLVDVATWDLARRSSAGRRSSSSSAASRARSWRPRSSVTRRR
jgi:L-alanine-DL-glutamate epimerase-like enolase superfamily enzyme